MAYELIDVNGVAINHHDLQDKGPWCQFGVSREDVFVQTYGDALGVIINPEKQTNKFAPDLLILESKQVADLKVQNTPFFQANTRFKMDPRFTVVFNKKDRDRYEKLYPEIVIFFWVNWIAVRFRSQSDDIAVMPLMGIWKISFKNLLPILDAAPLHEYIQRKDDNRGNARASYVIDLQDPRFERVV